LAIKNNQTNSAFNISTGVETSANQIFNHLKEILGLSIKEEYDLAKQEEQQRSVIDYSYAKNDFTLEPANIPS